MLFGLVTSQQIKFFDPQTNDHYNDYTFDPTKFNNAKIIVAYPFQQNSIKEKIGQNLQIEFFNLSDVLQTRNQQLFNLNDKQQPKVQLEIDFDNQIVKSYFKTNEGVEIISNKEFERTFTPTQDIEDQYYHFLKKYEIKNQYRNVNQLPQFKDALNLTNIQAFSKENSQIIYSNISNNLICDLVISNLATSVIIISKNVQNFSSLNFVKDRQYFKQLFCDISIRIISEQGSLFDYI
ncbi:unnamed protein product (macronuclear) [Paramecium tetraurelia]|uniref:Transmembrane protein n=1 Tax=Paramecium tetraurelia TaxID=5888 RepID=A0CR77_PARTE|nr:uncharacterized protein GSPATT00009609001 [Paramecium tetraurelia]CAK73294.1 unnamed protein product [Paramecium tetraurelia]|eukprot:XP_001440691.1 hypothetical protein (macronuclear) [Paramecium tetraurelia strain d4-2]